MSTADVVIKCEEFIDNEVHPDDENNSYFNIYESREETEHENDENRRDENDYVNDDIKMQELLREFDLEILFTILKFGDITYRSLKYISENDINAAIRSIAYRAEFREKLFAWRRDKYGLNDFSVLPPPKTASSLMPLGVNNSNNIQTHNINTYNTNAPSRVTPGPYDHMTTTTTTKTTTATNTKQQPPGVASRTRRLSTPKTNSAKKPRITTQAQEKQNKRTTNSSPPSPTPTASRSMTSPTPTLSDTMSLLQQETSRMDSHPSMEYDDPLCYQPTTSSAAAAATQPTGSMKSEASASSHAQPKMAFEKLKMDRSNKRLDAVQMKQIEENLRNGMTYRQISIHLQVSLGVISKYRKTLQALPTKNKKGRKKLLSETLEKEIVRDLQGQKYKSAVQIKRHLDECENLKVSAETIRRTLRDAGIRDHAKIKKSLLAKSHENIRLNFAKQYANWTIDDWSRVIWSAELTINRIGSDGKEWAWKEKGEKIQSRHVKPTLKCGGGSIMVWGCMMAKGIGTIFRIMDKMTSSSYIEMLNSQLMSSIDIFDSEASDIVFQQGNNAEHTADITQKWFSDKQINVLSWPPQSPDLNPIEDLWGILKEAVTGEIANVDELWLKLKNAWENIPPETCKTLVESMPMRIQAVIDSNGGYPK